KSLGIPIYFAPEIVGWHLQPPTIEGACIQNYKYGLGVAEVAIKEPRVMTLPEFRLLLETHSRLRGNASASTKLKKIIRKPLSLPVVRTGLLKFVSSRWA